MNRDTETKSSIKDYLWYGIIVMITAGAFYINYAMEISAPVKAILWIFWIIMTFLCLFMTQKGTQIFEFFKESRTELLKVVWPTRQETVQTTIIVMVMVGITGFVLWGIDSIMIWAIAKITHLG